MLRFYWFSVLVYNIIQSEASKTPGSHVWSSNGTKLKTPNLHMTLKTIQRVAQWVMQLDLPNNSYKPITNTAWVRVRLCKLQKGCTRLADASDKVYQLLAHGQWFSPGTPVSSTSKTGRHDIAEILLKVALNTINQIKSTFDAPW